MSGTKAAGGSAQRLKWARIVVFCLSRWFLYRKPPQFLFCSWTDHENPQCCHLTHRHQWEKLRNHFASTLLGAWRCRRDHFVKSCCISPFLMQCAWTSWSQRQMHLSYEYLSCWVLSLAVQDTKTANPFWPFVQEHQLFSGWAVIDPVSHWVTESLCKFLCFP